MSSTNAGRGGIEWPTLGLIAACYMVWTLSVGPLWSAFAPFAFVLATLSIALFSSLQHEILHGHPFRSRALNEALVFPGFTLVVPYVRFRDTHLAHHRDEFLTDPYDDPESNYLDPAIWERLSRPMRRLLRMNNTLAGRMLLGPAISTVAFVRSDWCAIRGGDRKVRDAWVLHAIGVAMVLAWLLAFGAMPVWAYVLAAYAAYGMLKIRTFLEHRAHEKARGRSVVIEDRGPLAFLFLNNNFHAVHHAHPRVAWYRLPALYAERREQVLARNEGYRYGSYSEVFRKHLFRAKDPVPHPLMRQD
ncbi:fatty acid desaturase [Ostreiculturibacter nitratireducens]|uniref:fatty acid desaturase n=1 Tax=Ostreiculturibacter nitratireducens TaxID=3075226 RepID=UPI0031B59D1A